MNKILFLIALAFLTAGTANARTRTITDWQGELPGESEKNSLNTSCSKSCESYELTTLICPEGQKLVSCPVKGCEYYYRCEYEE